VIYILIQLINSALTAVLIGWVLLHNERYGFR
jgi:hypothetical protein